MTIYPWQTIDPKTINRSTVLGEARYRVLALLRAHPDDAAAVRRGMVRMLSQAYWCGNVGDREDLPPTPKGLETKPLGPGEFARRGLEAWRAAVRLEYNKLTGLAAENRKKRQDRQAELFTPRPIHHTAQDAAA